MLLRLRQLLAKGTRHSCSPLPRCARGSPNREHLGGTLKPRRSVARRESQTQEVVLTSMVIGSLTEFNQARSTGRPKDCHSAADYICKSDVVVCQFDSS